MSKGIKKIKTPTDNELIQGIKRGLATKEHIALNQLYGKYLNMTLNYLCKPTSPQRDLAATAYQETILILVKRAKEGDLDDNIGAVKPWIFKVAYYQFCKLVNPKKPSVVCLDEKIIKKESEIGTEFTDDRLKVLRAARNKLSKKCRLLLYYRYSCKPKYTSTEIATLLGYKSENTVDATKSRCIKSLRKLTLTEITTDAK